MSDLGPQWPFVPVIELSPDSCLLFVHCLFDSFVILDELKDLYRIKMECVLQER